METIEIYDGNREDGKPYVSVVFKNDDQSIETKRFYLEEGNNRDTALGQCLNQVAILLDPSIQ